MRLLITCQFSDGIQVLIKDPATGADARALDIARHGDPDSILIIRCRTTPDGPVRGRLVRAGAILSVERRP